MSEVPEQADSVGSPDVRESRRGPSLVWFVPLVALALGGWLVYQSWISSGPLVTISFENAQGLEAGSTSIKYRDVAIGQVESVEIDLDFKSVIVTARLNRRAAPYLNESTKFWVERPRVGSGGISGFGTLFSGAHIGFEATQGGESRRDFKGLESPPLVSADSDGLRVILEADSVDSLVPGSPVYFKSFEVGTIESVELDEDFSRVLVKAFIDAPYDRLVQKESRFWNVSGISAQLNSEGISVSFQSLESLLIGGIEFDSPTLGRSDEVVENDQLFRLFDNYRALGVESFSHKVYYIVNFDQSIRGLNVDAAVEYRGLKIGRVVDISSRYNESDKEILLPVLIEVEPERLGIVVNDSEDNQQAHQSIVDLGLRAKLEIGNLITGQLYISLDFYEDAEPAQLSDFEGFKQIPTISTDLNRIAQNVDEALEKINNLEVEKLVDNLNGTIDEIRQTVIDVRDTVASAGQFMNNSDEAVDKMVSSIQSALGRSERLLNSGTVMFDQGQTMLQSLDEGSATRYQLDQTLKEMQAAARSLKTLTETIEQNPNSLIFGKQR